MNNEIEFKNFWSNKINYINNIQINYNIEQTKFSKFENIEFYVLDEIFSGLDLKVQNVLKDRLIELNSQLKTIVIVEHNEDIIKDLKNYIMMEEFECKQKILK